MNEAWLIIGPVALAVAGYLISTELKRLNAELTKVRHDLFHLNIEIIKIKEALEQ